MSRFLKQIPAVVLVLLVLNCLFFLLSILDNDWQTQMALYYYQYNLYQPWQWLTHMFMHGSFAHLAFNMIALVSFSTVLVKTVGTRRFLILYILSGLGAALLNMGIDFYHTQQGFSVLQNHGFSEQTIINTLNQGEIYTVWTQILGAANLNNMASSFMSSVVGASGAIYGVLIAFAMLFPNAKILFIFFPKPIAAKFLVPIILAIDLIGGISNNSLSFLDGNIAHFAHLGGALTGFFVVLWWKKVFLAEAQNQPFQP